MRDWFSKRITRHRIRRFVSKCAATAMIQPPVLDAGAGYRHNFKEAGRPLPFDTLDAHEPLNPTFIGDVQAMPIPDGRYRTVICTEVIEHVPDPQKALAECFRVLQQHGVLVLTTPFMFRIHEKEHQPDYWRFTPRALRMMLERAGFVGIVIELGGSSLRPTGVFCTARKPSDKQQRVALPLEDQ